MSQDNRPDTNGPPTPPPGPGKPIYNPRSTPSRASAMRQVEDIVDQLGINPNLGIKVLIVAVVSGLAAAVLDKVLGLPTEALRFTFGWVIAALNGATYAFFKNHDDRAGLIMSAVAGLVAFVVWFIVMEVIGGEFGLSYGLNIFKAIVTGIIAGLIGFGWFALMRKLPDKLIP
jgi:hypothetical protein